MKNIVIFGIMVFLLLSLASSFVFAEDIDLIKYVEINLKNSETPNRLEVSFNLAESINLSKGSSNIIYEYFTQNSSGDLQAINYKKDKTWSGYINSYDNYPNGEYKYSTGSTNDTNYSDNIPATQIYTSTKTGSSIDVTQVYAVRITVLREDSSGERTIIYSDGTRSANEKIEVPILDVDKDTKIRLETTTASLPTDTVLLAREVINNDIFDKVSTILKEVKNLIVFEISLESNGEKIQPNGKVNISIPIPTDFDTSKLVVYRIDNNSKIDCLATVTKIDGLNYATFETEHFSSYALVEKEVKEEITKDDTPQTGTKQFVHYAIIITIISIIGIFISNRKKIKNQM